MNIQNSSLTSFILDFESLISDLNREQQKVLEQKIINKMQKTNMLLSNREVLVLINEVLDEYR